MRLECDAILFDLDGVLVDSRACVERHWRRWAAAHDLEAAEVLAVVHGRRMVEVMQQFRPDLSPEAVAQEAARLAGREGVDTEGVRRYRPGRAILRMLPRERWAVVTSGNTLTATTRIRHTRLPEPRVLVTADDVTRGKPHPEPYLQAAARLGHDPARCLVLEDAPAGIEAARRAGMRVVAVATTHPAAALAAADGVIGRLADFWPSPLEEHLLVSIREVIPS